MGVRKKNKSKKGQKRGHVDSDTLLILKRITSTLLVRFGGSKVGRILAESLGSWGLILGLQEMARSLWQTNWGRKLRAPLHIAGCPVPDHGFWAATQRRRIEIDTACIPESTEGNQALIEATYCKHVFALAEH